MPVALNTPVLRPRPTGSADSGPVVNHRRDNVEGVARSTTSKNSPATVANHGNRPFRRFGTATQVLGSTYRFSYNISNRDPNTRLVVHLSIPGADSLIAKTDPKQYVRFDKPRNGCGMGCCSIGCMGMVGMLIMVAVVGYYGLFHSNLALQLFEAAIEQDGKVEIEGLTGNLWSGFSADELRFKTVDDRWSSLSNIKFNYESDASLMGTERLVIKELSVDGGTIYADWDSDESEIEFDPGLGEEFEKEFDELGSDFHDEIGTLSSFRELRIELVSVANLKIINPATELEITIDEIRFAGFHWKKGDFQSLGELFAHSSQLDLKTVPSVMYAEMKHSERFEGTLWAQANPRLKADLPFVVDIGIDDDLNVFVSADLCNGQFRLVDDSDQSTLSYLDFSLSDFVQFKSGKTLPSKVNLQLEYGKNKKLGPINVDNDGSFEWGRTRFNNLQIEPSEKGLPTLVATGKVNNEDVKASIRIKNPLSAFWNVSLQSEAFDTLENLWAQTLFGNAFEKLANEEQKIVRAAIAQQTADSTEDQNQIESSVNGSPERGDADRHRDKDDDEDAHSNCE